MHPTSPTAVTTAARWSYRQQWTLLGMAMLILLLIVAGYEALQKPQTGWERLRETAVWNGLLRNGKPTVFVIGDYYIFGDTEQSSDVKRLIREFSINSKDDLDQFLQTNPSLAERYMDVGLKYLPISSGFALANILPILAINEHKRARVC